MEEFTFEEKRKESSKLRTPPDKFNFMEVCFEVAKRMKKRQGWTESETLAKTGFYIKD